MDFLTIVGIIIILGVACFMFLRERKYKLLYSGRNQSFYVVPLIIIIFIVVTVISGKAFKLADIIVILAIIPIGFVGNKCGITEDGVLLSTYLTKWEKIKSYSIVEQKNNCVFFYESNGMTRKILFSKETGEEVDNYLSKNRKIRHRKNS